ncbi:DUF106 domain-containing protein [archaeon]|nr:DUF106 domain-containing protein [archaeon]
MLEGIFDPTLKPILLLPGAWGVIIISLILTLIITLAYKFLTNQKEMKQLKLEIKELQNQAKEMRNYPEKMVDINKQVMEKNMKYMMKSFKPTLFTLIPIIFIFGYINSFYSDLGNPKLLFGLSWIWIYIISSIIFSMALRKLLKIY